MSEREHRGYRVRFVGSDGDDWYWSMSSDTNFLCSVEKPAPVTRTQALFIFANVPFGTMVSVYGRKKVSK